MRVRVSYVVEVDDAYRRALRAYYGEDGLATREDLKRHFRVNGFTLDDDLLFEHQVREESEDDTE